MFMLRTVTSFGRLAMWTTASATCFASNHGSSRREPFACRVPCVLGVAISVKAFPAGQETVRLVPVLSVTRRSISLMPRKLNEENKGHPPMSICVQVILKGRPSNEVHFVNPAIACFDAVYGAPNGRGVCADTEPLLMMRPGTTCSLISVC